VLRGRRHLRFSKEFYELNRKIAVAQVDCAGL
jgi:hypothetical protein